MGTACATMTSVAAIPGKRKPGGSDADDGPARVTDLNGALQRPRVGSEPRPPQLVAHHHDGRRAVTRVLVAQETPEGRAQPQRHERIGCHRHTLHPQPGSPSP